MTSKLGRLAATPSLVSSSPSLPALVAHQVVLRAA
jgi:hypothetical protein